MNKSPVVSIVTITYNQEKYIREALESFLIQKTDFPFEVIIGDDCSTDSTPEIIREYSEKYPNIFKPILRRKNLGAAKNSIATLREAGGKYIALCEGDDFWSDSSKLQMQVDFLNAHPDYSLCFHPVRVFYDNNEEREITWPNTQIEDESKINVNELLKENFIPTNSVMYRRQNYDSIPDDVMPLDWYLHLFHAQFGKIGFINKTMSAYRRHSRGVWWDSFKDLGKLWKKYGIAYVSLHVELVKLYGDDETKRDIINKNLAQAIENLVGVDKKHGDHLLHNAVEKFPEVIEPYALVQHEKAVAREGLIEKQKQEIERLNQVIVGLRAEVFKIRDELHSLTTARLLGKIIKIRGFIGYQLPRLKRSPLTVPRWFKRKIADMLPAPVRLVLRNTRRTLTLLVKKLLGYGKQSQTKYIRTTNPKKAEKEPLVSVVIPFYNHADTIDDTLGSLEAQTFQDFEIIIVNDGSTDQNSIKKVQEIKRRGSNRLRVIEQENQGVAAARNNGIKIAHGRYIVCLDSDDLLDSTYIEKCTTVLETTPDVSLVTSQMEIFGVINEPFKHAAYDPITLYYDNMVIVAAEFTKKAWKASGGYKSKIGYEDWEHWLNLAEHGFLGKTLPEPLFRYRTSMQSRYIEDKDVHWSHVKAIRTLHPQYKKLVKKIQNQQKNSVRIVDPSEAFINMYDKSQYLPPAAHKINVLITIPWMTFGGAETLIYNYCREIKDRFNLSFVTGQKSEHEWEYKFREVTPNIYHLANLFDDPKMHLEFISNYIKTRNIDVLHAIHNGFTFAMMPELKKRHPHLKIILTLFNDRVPEYVQGAIEYQQYIDQFVSDNAAVAKNLGSKLGDNARFTVIPNGIDVYNEFSASLFDSEAERAGLSLQKKDIAIFFVGRLSEEKNPDVFIRAAAAIARSASHKHLKFFMIGDGPMRQELEALMRQVNADNLTYLGYQPVTEVAKYLSAADIFVLPSKIEGFPLSILEAMGMGVAVIASDVGAVSEVIDSGEDGYVITPGATDEIVKIIKNLAGNEAKLGDIKKKTRAKAESKYSNRILGVNYRKLYDEIAE